MVAPLQGGPAVRCLAQAPATAASPAPLRPLGRLRAVPSLLGLGLPATGGGGSAAPRGCHPLGPAASLRHHCPLVARPGLAAVGRGAGRAHAQTQGRPRWPAGRQPGPWGGARGPWGVPVPAFRRRTGLHCSPARHTGPDGSRWQSRPGWGGARPAASGRGPSRVRCTPTAGGHPVTHVGVPGASPVVTRCPPACPRVSPASQGGRETPLLCSQTPTLWGCSPGRRVCPRELTPLQARAPSASSPEACKPQGSSLPQ